MLALEHVSKFYGDRPILKDVSLSLVPGRIFLLAGANGAGKSTLLRLLAGLSRPDAGVVRRGREDVRIGFLGHAPMLYGGLSALENLVFWSRAQGLTLDGQGLMAALEQVGLAGHAHDLAASFSRGMAQRLDLARALMARPEALLLDEPGTGLDDPSRALLGQMLVAARARGAAVLWVSHSLAEDAPLADGIWRITDCRLTCEKGEDACCASA